MHAATPRGRQAMQSRAGPIPRAKSLSRINFSPSEKPGSRNKIGAGFFFPAPGMQDNNREANEMKRAKENFARPYGLRDYEFVRAGPDGAYWQHSDGMVVRMAAPEVDRAQMRKADERRASMAEWEVALGRSGAT